MRNLEKEFNSGELHFFLNSVNGPDQWTGVHCHDLPHTGIPLSPMSPLITKVKTVDGWQRLMVEQFGPMSFPTIQAGREHIVGVEQFTHWTPELVMARAAEIAERLNQVEGKWMCAFSRFGPGGSGPDLYRPDPKRSTGNPHPVLY